MLSRRPLVIGACLVVVPYLLGQFFSLHLRTRTGTNLWPTTFLGCGSDREHDDNLVAPQKRFRVAVASHFGFHFDVYLALVWTLERVLGRDGYKGTVEVYADQPFGFGFQQIVEERGLYHGIVHAPDDLVRNLNASTDIDLLVLGTCEIDLRQPHEELLAAWDARPMEHKFKLVCIVHNAEDDAWQSNIPEWARRNAIRILPISEHVGTAFRKSFLTHADSPDASIRYAGLENVPIDVHVPILDLPLADSKKRKILSDAVIQGSFFADRRDYVKIFAELIESLQMDPGVWGYRRRQDNEVAYVQDRGLPDPPFRLWLVGSGYMEVPPELEHVVVVRDGLEYPEFYKLMSEMDICVPAFSAENGYYDVQASSTFAMAVECNVPLLLTDRMKRAYTYVDDPRAAVTRPAAMREVEALRALRTGDVSYFMGRTGIAVDSPTATAARRMVQQGWTKSEAESRAFKKSVWTENERVVERILRDL